MTSACGHTHIQMMHSQEEMMSHSAKQTWQRGGPPRHHLLVLGCRSLSVRQLNHRRCASVGQRRLLAVGASAHQMHSLSCTNRTLKAEGDKWRALKVMKEIFGSRFRETSIRHMGTILEENLVQASRVELRLVMSLSHLGLLTSSPAMLNHSQQCLRP